MPRLLGPRKIYNSAEFKATAVALSRLDGVAVKVRQNFCVGTLRPSQSSNLHTQICRLSGCGADAGC